MIEQRHKLKLLRKALHDHRLPHPQLLAERLLNDCHDLHNDKEIIEYWSGEPLNTNAGGAAYYQNPLNAYTVDLPPLDAPDEAGSYSGNVAAMDALLSEGVVVRIVGLGKTATTTKTCCARSGLRPSRLIMKYDRFPAAQVLLTTQATVLID